MQICNCLARRLAGQQLRCPARSSGTRQSLRGREKRLLGRFATKVGAQSSSIEPPDVRKLAKLAQIKVTDEEVAEWEPKLREIVQWFDQLQAIDVEGVPPCTRSSLANFLAAGKDEPAVYKQRDALLESAPDMEGPYVKVPKIL